MLRAFFVRPRTGKIDWSLVAIFFISLFSFIGAVVLYMNAVAK
jgi:hypothetical protein